MLDNYGITSRGRIINNQLYINFTLGNKNFYFYIRNYLDYYLQIDIYDMYNVRRPYTIKYDVDNTEELYEKLTYFIRTLQPRMVY